MKKLVITTIILLTAVVGVTVMYFENLNPPGSNTSRVMAAIPDNASVVFQFSNEKSFYDIFSKDSLLTAVAGKQKIKELNTLRSVLLTNAALSKYFDGQSLFISLHPSADNKVGLLLTVSAIKGFDIDLINKLSRQQNTGMVITPLHLNGAQGYSLYFSLLKMRFYVIDKGDNVFSGSFDEDVARQSAVYKQKNDRQNFVMLPEQQNSSSLANIYINNMQLQPLFDQLFSDKNTDILRRFAAFPAQAALSLNYRSDAFMFSGTTTLLRNRPMSYLSLFTGQQPVVNHLKDIFPATTAYNTSFSVSNPLKFGADLYDFHVKGGLKPEQDALFKKIKAETGVNLRIEFTGLLGNEFAIVTTRYQEKFAIIAVNDGSKMMPVMRNISNMATDNIGQVNYNKLPFFLLGDAFSVLKRPYFMILDNYLILATSQAELTSYNDTYFNRKFLSKMEQYNRFDNLLSERSNVAFFINFKNADPILKLELTPGFYKAYRTNQPGWRNFYGASYQYSAADNNFYTNFCMRFNNTDTAAVNNNF